jgi:hypothetical protein
MTQHGEDQMQRLAIELDIKAPWVKTWGRSHKVATFKFGVNTTPFKVARGLRDNPFNFERQCEREKRFYMDSLWTFVWLATIDVSWAQVLTEHDRWGEVQWFHCW